MILPAVDGVCHLRVPALVESPSVVESAVETDDPVVVLVLIVVQIQKDLDGLADGRDGIATARIVLLQHGDFRLLTT